MYLWKMDEAQREILENETLAREEFQTEVLNMVKDELKTEQSMREIEHAELKTNILNEMHKYHQEMFRLIDRKNRDSCRVP